MLRFAYTDPATGVELDQAIAKIDRAELPSMDGPLTVVFGVYASGRALLAGKAPLDTITLTIVQPQLSEYIEQVASLIESRAVNQHPTFQYATLIPNPPRSR